MASRTGRGKDPGTVQRAQRRWFGLGNVFRDAAARRHARRFPSIGATTRVRVTRSGKIACLELLVFPPFPNSLIHDPPANPLPCTNPAFLMSFSPFPTCPLLFSSAFVPFLFQRQDVQLRQSSIESSSWRTSAHSSISGRNIMWIRTHHQTYSYKSRRLQG